jgi:hypothetical protein
MIPDDHKFNAIGGDINLLNIAPKTKKLLPFPLENIEEELGDIYFKLDLVRKRIEVAKRANGATKTTPQQKKYKRTQYKINTTMSIIRQIVKDLDSLWVN